MLYHCKLTRKVYNITAKYLDDTFVNWQKLSDELIAQQLNKIIEPYKKLGISYVDHELWSLSDRQGYIHDKNFERIHFDNNANFSTDAIKFIDNQTHNLCIVAVQNNGDALQFVKTQTDEICIAAVKKSFSALQYVEHQTDKICLEAVKS